MISPPDKKHLKSSKALPIIELIDTSTNNFYALGTLDRKNYLPSYNHLKSLLKTPWKKVDQIIINALELILKNSAPIYPEFYKNVSAYSRGLGVEYESIAMTYLIPEIVSSMSKWMPRVPTFLWGCSSYFQGNDEGTPKHIRLLDFPLVGSYDNAERILIFNEPGYQKITSFSSAGFCYPSLTAMNESGITLALHQKFTHIFNPSGTPIFEIAFQLLKQCNDRQSVLSFLNGQKSISSWGLYIGLPSGEVLCCDLLGKKSDIKIHDIKPGQVLYFNNLLENKKNSSSNKIPFGLENHCSMRNKIAKIKIKKIVESKIDNSSDLLKEISTLHQHTGIPKNWAQDPISPHTITSCVLDPINSKIMYIPGSAPKYFNGEIHVVNKIWNKNKKREVLNLAEPIRNNQYLGLENLILAQTYFDLGKIHNCYHKIQQAISLLNNYPEKYIANFYFSVFRFKFEKNHNTNIRLLKEFTLLEKKLPVYLADHCRLFIYRLQKHLKQKITIKEINIKNNNLKKVFKFERKIPAKVLIKTISPIMNPRIELLDIIYGHKT